MAVQLMINVKLWSTVTVGGGDTVMMVEMDDVSCIYDNSK